MHEFGKPRNVSIPLASFSLSKLTREGSLILFWITDERILLNLFSTNKKCAYLKALETLWKLKCIASMMFNLLNSLTTSFSQDRHGDVIRNRLDYKTRILHIFSSGHYLCSYRKWISLDLRVMIHMHKQCQKQVHLVLTRVM